MFFSNFNIIHMLVFRLFCCIFSNTWFVPDEYFQSVEVSYHIVYGKGHLSWEWLTKWSLRSPLHPLLYAIPFWILKSFSLDFGFIIKWIPNIIQALLFAVADICYINWAKKLVGSQQVLFLLLFLYFTNWFIIYCSTRTLSNTLECCLTLIALNFYIKKEEINLKKKNDDFKEKKVLKTFIFKFFSNYSFCLMFIFLTTIIRPTTCLLWLLLFICHFLDYYNENKIYFGINFLYETGNYFLSFFLLPIFIPIFTLFIDSYFYGQPTFTLFNFFYFNILKNGNALFGSHPWHWYITQGLPSIFGFVLIPLINFLFKSIWNSSSECIKLPKRYAFASFLYIFCLSLIAHKEHRFVLPIIPLLLPYIAVELNYYKVKYYFKYFKNLIIISNLLAIIYFGLIHQRGPFVASNQISQYVNNQLKLNKNNGTIYVLQLMPCFSLPMYASMHPNAQNVVIKMLDCGINDKIDESDQFHSSPEFWLNKYWFTKKLYLTNIIVCYQNIFVQIEPFLMQKGFERYSQIFHTIFTSSSRQNQKIILMTKK